MYIEPEREAIIAFLQRQLDGPIVMLNLLRFRDQADYSQHPQLAPQYPISGAQAYQLYMQHTEPFLTQAGGRLLFVADGGAPIIGPTDERWDTILLVEHKNSQVFLEFANNTDYLAGIGHRVAALEDSRLLPMQAQRDAFLDASD